MGLAPSQLALHLLRDYCHTKCLQFKPTVSNARAVMLSFSRSFYTIKEPYIDFSVSEQVGEWGNFLSDDLRQNAYIWGSSRQPLEQQQQPLLEI